MIRLYAQRYDEFRDIYFETAFSIICGLGKRKNSALTDHMLHFPNTEYKAARELVWRLYDNGLYPRLTGDGTGFPEWNVKETDEIRDLTEDGLRDALRPLILGNVNTLRVARGFLKNPPGAAPGGGGYSREIQSVLEETGLMYNTETDSEDISGKKNKDKVEYLCKKGTTPNLIPYIPCSAEKKVLESLLNKKHIDDDRRKIREVLILRWGFWDYLIKYGYERLRDKKPVSENPRWKNLAISACLVSLLGIRSCPYCNRNYIGTTGKKNLGYELDHYINKSMYPFFSMSLYNLIPSCGVCNGGKHAVDDIDVISPFEDSLDYDRALDFVYIPYFAAEDGQGDVRISIRERDEELRRRHKATVDMLELNECYKYNKEEADDFIRKMIYYPESMMKELGRTVNGSKENSVLAERVLEADMFGEGMCEPDEYGKRPLSMMYRHLYRKYRK